MSNDGFIRIDCQEEIAQQESSRLQDDPGPSRKWCVETAQPIFQIVVQHPAFSTTMATVVFLSCAALGYETDLAAKHGLGAMPFDFSTVDTAFCVVFTMELLVRICAVGPTQFIMVPEQRLWNVFDTVLLIVQIVDQTQRESTSALRLFRAARAFRIVVSLSRLLRVSRAVRATESLEQELTAALDGFAGAIVNLLGSMMVLLVVIYMFSVPLLEVIAANGQLQTNEVLVFLFGGLFRVMWTLTECSTGGLSWDEAISPLLLSTSPLAVVLFCSFIGVSAVIGLNLVAGVFAGKLSASLKSGDDEIKMQLRNLKQRFSEIDISKLIERDRAESNATLSLHHSSSGIISEHSSVNVSIPRSSSDFMGSEEGRCNSFLGCVVRSESFEAAMGVLVIASSVLLGYEADFSAMHGQEELPIHMHIASAVLNAIFTVELGLRLLTEGCRTFAWGDDWRWNWFDFVLLVVSVINQAYGVLRLLRIGRAFNTMRIIARILRFIRSIQAIQSIRIQRDLSALFEGMTDSLVSVVWVLALLLLMFYGFSVVLLDVLIEQDALFDHPDLMEWFGGLFRTILTMIECGGSTMLFGVGGVAWGQVLQPLVRLRLHFATFLYCTFLISSIVLMVNFFSGLLAHKAVVMFQKRDDELTAIISHLNESLDLIYPKQLHQPVPSLVRVQTGSTTCAILPTKLDRWHLNEKLENGVFFNPESMEEVETLQVVLDMLVDGKGGAVVVVCDSQPEERRDSLRYTNLSKDLLSCFVHFGRNIHSDRQAVMAFLRAFREHTNSDKWESWLIEKLSRELGCTEVLPILRVLEKQPKDGALVIDFKGNIQGAAVRLRHSDMSMYKIEGKGTRHAAGLGVTEHFCRLWRKRGPFISSPPGAVFVASDDGGLTLMLPTLQGFPEVLVME
eukprot:TRINITY_DN49681_c0_g1_i1.p1 TRINITY_DN49681_c0_g1~~TRINITY_DN49681_c0_g1_i1.p1  ORF type:complete len:904 (-),score=130.08 TRINITY_DN49681_c0_g1_i1:213-2924(-)